MPDSSGPPPLTPLQRAIYEVDRLGLGLRESARLVTQQIGFFVGQERYLQERRRIAAIEAQYGAVVGGDATERPSGAAHQVGSP